MTVFLYIFLLIDYAYMFCTAYRRDIPLLWWMQLHTSGSILRSMLTTSSIQVKYFAGWQLYRIWNIPSIYDVEDNICWCGFFVIATSKYIVTRCKLISLICRRFFICWRMIQFISMFRIVDSYLYASLCDHWHFQFFI